MKILRILGLVLLLLVGILLLLGAIAPKAVDTSRSLTMAAPPAAVFSVVNDLTSWPEWNPWAQRDATMDWTFGETTEGPGAYYSWTSENSGSGRMDITNTWGTDSLATLVRFDGQGEATSLWTFTPTDAGTDVSWTFHTDFPFPFNAMLLFQDFKGMIDADYEEGLALLKTYVEAQVPSSPGLSVERIDFPGAYYLTTRAKLSFAEMNEHFPDAMAALVMAVENKGIAPTGAPASLTYLWDEENELIDMAVGVPVADGTEVEGLTAAKLAPGSALKVDYYGSSSGTQVAHELIDAYARAQNLVIKLPVMEWYITDPSTEPDSTKWLTQVVYLLDE